MRLIFFTFLLICSGICNSVGSIVLLIGTSSAGKTSIAIELEKILDDFTYIGVDTYHWKLMIQDMKDKKRAACFMSDDEIKRLVMTTQEGYDIWMEHESRNWKDGRMLCNQEVQKMALDGNNIIFDTVLGDFGEEEAIDLFSKVRNIPIVIIWVYCDIISLVGHVQQRNLFAHVSEKRDIMLVLKQFLNLYNPVNNHMYDCLEKKDLKNLFVDFKLLSSLSFSKITADELDDIFALYMNKFFTSEIDVVNIASKYSYDLLVNTSKKSSIEIAQEIKSYLEGCCKADAIMQNYHDFCI